MAGAVFKDIVAKRGLEAHFDRIESAGTADYHIGEEPDTRTWETCKRHAVPIDSVAQHADSELLSRFDYVIAMDEQNLSTLKSRTKGRVVKMFGEFDPQGAGARIADPYYGRGDAGFERCFEQIVRYSDGLLADMGFPQAKS